LVIPSFSGRKVNEGSVHVSDYTAVFEREGQVWTAEIAEQPDIRTTADSLPRARTLIREALAAKLDADLATLKVVDKIGVPKRYTATREAVRATRTERDMAIMMDKMTGPITAREWAEDLRLAGRPSHAVDFLASVDGDVTFTMDQLCHRISVAEEIGRWGELEGADDRNELQES
jgi:predicted RNase H-like HicB family nuclease